MQRIPGTPTPPRTRLGGPVSFRGQTYRSAAALEHALTAAVGDAGATYTVRLTPKGRHLAARLAAARTLEGARR